MPGNFFHAHARESFAKKQQEMEEQSKHVATFVARPAPKFGKAPKVAASTKPLTAAGSPGLATKTRQSQRKAFDEMIKRKAEAEAAARAEAEEAAKLAEEEEIKQLRKTMEFKAKPVMHEIPANIFVSKKVAPKPLTTPLTPQFATAKRAMLRSLNPQE